MDWWVQFIPKISWSPQLIIPSMIEKKQANGNVI